MSAARFSCDVAVVGAGPAGLAAARAAAEAGARVVCLDAFATPGGQYAMQPTQAESPFAATAPVALGRAAARAAGEAGAQILCGAEVFWGARVPGGVCLSVNHEGRALAVEAKALVVAAGAIERPLPFPGWTLPGVIGAGAAQRLLKTGTGALPGPGKTVLAGSGPFLLAVAQSFAKAGQRLDHVVEMQRPSPAVIARIFARHPGKLAEAARLGLDLRRSGAARHMGHMVTRALGTDRLEAVEIAPLSSAGQPEMGRARVIEGVGTLAIGYGFQPVIDLTTALGAAHDFDAALGGWHCRADADGRTTVASLWAAGETLGIGGAVPAQLSGHIAGAGAARALGFSAPDVTGATQALRKARAFAAALARLYPPPQGLPVALPEDELICRCEDVTAGDIANAIAEGAHESFAVKTWTRAGMGPCQGRICGAGIAAALAQAGVPADRASYNRAHLPLRPVPLPLVRATLQAQTEMETRP
ncbi:FAD-dependent oxidoreductase [Salipiger thiooxidans]|uniref:FAD-dependent oxidoreductase n=1 Tax=Salipiger thiooxidans TaxID=282683 RepID=UPI001CD69B12|nr:FAD-dependent oxidoreductase [Salipiger thiooxidans]MCA0849386.1 FAD-dependent oxidoreductase [Salipiger thiooxidans]